MKFIIPCVISFLLTAAITPVIIRVATSCNCVDIPGERHLHDRITPCWGGLAFFAGVLPFLLSAHSGSRLTAYLIASSLLVAMGMIDDLKSLAWKVKFIVMAVATAIVIFGGDITVQHLGVYGALGHLELGMFSIPFTFISIIGITNAINLLDGLDGLAGGVSLLAFLCMGIAALLAGNLAVAFICVVFVGALAAFLLYNFPRARIFMGDTGSLFLGFSLAITAILLTQDQLVPVHAMFPALVLLIPIFDTLRVLVVRLKNGINPFKADNRHLHHLLVQSNISPMNVTLLLWSVTALFGAVALVLTTWTSMAYLNVTLVAASLLSLGTICLTQQLEYRKTGSSALCRLSIKKDGSVSPPRYFSPGTDFAKTGGTLLIKFAMVLVIVLLAAQAIAD